MNEVEVEYTLEQKDFILGALFGLYRNKMLLVITGLMLVVSFTMIPGAFAKGDPSEILRGSIFPVLFLIFLPMLTVLSARRQFRSLPEGKRNVRLKISIEGIEFQDGLSFSKMEWANVPRLAENGFAFHLYFTSAVVQVVPKRVFREEAQLQAVRALFREQLGSRANVRAA